MTYSIEILNVNKEIKDKISEAVKSIVGDEFYESFYACYED